MIAGNLFEVDETRTKASGSKCRNIEMHVKSFRIAKRISRFFSSTTHFE